MDDYKIAFIDIETAPNLGYTWAKYEQNVIEFTQEWYLLSFAVKWAGSKKVKVYALPDYDQWKEDKTNDLGLAVELWGVLEQADLVVAHNGDRFDLRKANARFLVHGLIPPAPYKTVDTLKLARKYFNFNSNKLNDLANLLGLGSKAETGGFSLWLDCMKGDQKAWKQMKKYNAHDVVLLEQLYERLRPWHTAHPNVAIKQTALACPTCASQDVQKRGHSYLVNYRVQRFQCRDCGHWAKGSREKLAGERLA